MGAQELKEMAQRRFRASQYAEAVPLLKSATEAFPREESLWQDLVLAAGWSGQHAQAVEFAKEGLQHNPGSAQLWRQLAGELIALDRLDEAEKALNHARRLNPNADWLWRYLAELHRKQKQAGKEVEALEHLCALGAANWRDLNQLGIAYHNDRKLAKAAEYYRLAAAASADAIPLFNMGLVLRDPGVSQETDAADAFRRALARRPDHERAREQLEQVKASLLPLAARAREYGASLSDRPWVGYMSPLQALQLEDLPSEAEPNAKAIHRAKRRLLQELDLNGGKVSWMDDYQLDTSRAHKVDDELLDPTKARYHRAIYQNKPLLRFLTHGNIEHFLYSHDYFPQATIDLLDNDPKFRAFLSKIFALQYNAVLTRAIDRRLLPVLEALFSGRRWVLPEDEDACFEGAERRIADLLEKIRSKTETGRERKVSIAEIEGLLRQYSVPELFNRLPPVFARRQIDLIETIRSLAIACFNKHGDADLSREVLGLCNRLRCPSAELTGRLAEDFKTIERIIAEERRYTFTALVRANQSVTIGKAGIAYGGASVSVTEIEAIRWGVYIRTVNGAETERSFSLVTRTARSCLSVEWHKPGLLAAVRGFIRKPGEAVPIADLASDEQEGHFKRMLDAAIHYLVPPLIGKLVQRLQAGHGVIIGPCTLLRKGIVFRTGLLRKEHALSFEDVETQMHNGHVYVSSRTNRKVGVSMPLKETDNASLLPMLCAAMRKQSQ